MRSHTVPVSKQRTATSVGLQRVPARDRLSWISFLARCKSTCRTCQTQSLQKHGIARAHHQSGQGHLTYQGPALVQQPQALGQHNSSWAAVRARPYLRLLNVS